MSDRSPTAPADPQARLAQLVADHDVVDPTGRGDFWTLVDAVVAKLDLDERDVDRGDARATLDRLESTSSSSRSTRSTSASSAGAQGDQGAEGAQGTHGAQGAGGKAK